jgi:hypothetical protein
MSPSKQPFQVLHFRFELAFVDVYYAFAIKTNKYCLWLNEAQMVKIPFPEKWAQIIYDLIDVLEPNGKTQLKILKPGKAFSLGSSAEENNIVESQVDKNILIEIDVPKTYEKKFVHISQLLTTLKVDEGIAIIPILSSPHCLFCGSESISKEHIFPKWLRDFFEEFTLAPQLNIASNKDEELLDFFKSKFVDRKESSYGYTSNMVCKNCNENWMSQLEECVKSILTTSSGEETHLLTQLSNGSIDKRQSYDLARWLLLKTLLMVHKVSNNPFFSTDVYRRIKEGFIPVEMVVELAHSKSHKLQCTANTGANHLIPIQVKLCSLNEARELTRNFFMACFQIGNLLFRVSYLPFDCSFRRGICVKHTEILYPQGAELRYYPTELDEQFWDDAAAKGLELQIFNSGMLLSEAFD